MEQSKVASAILTNEELVELYRAGDPSALEALWLQNYGLIRQTVRKLCKNEPDAFEDEIQEAYFALIEAVDKYDKGGEAKLATYICNSIKWRKYSRYQLERRHHPENTISLNAPIIGFEDEDVTLESSIPDPDAEFEEDCVNGIADKQIRDRLKVVMSEIIAGLPKRVREVITERMKGRTLVEIGRKFDISASAAGQYERRAYRDFRSQENRTKLQEFLNYYDYLSFRHTGFAFWRDKGYSSVEWAAEKRAALEEKWVKKGDHNGNNV